MTLLEDTKEMLCLPMWQPWASLVATGAKQWETRGYPIKYRGRIAILATKKWTREQSVLSCTQPFKSGLVGSADGPSKQPGGIGFFLPLGCLIAIAEIVDVLTTREWLRRYCQKQPPFPHPTFERSKAEQTFGDYSPDRYAWQIDHVRQLVTPIPYKGHQGIWKLPPDVIEELLSAPKK